MTVNVISNGSKWAGELPDTIDKLVQVLQTETLDPTFEDYGNFVYDISDPDEWPAGVVPDTFKPDSLNLNRWFRFFGNFHTIAHVFNIDTNEPLLIERLTKAIRANQQTAGYLDAMEQVTK